MRGTSVSASNRLACSIRHVSHVLVGRQPGGVLEQARKMGRARLRHGGKLARDNSCSRWAWI